MAELNPLARRELPKDILDKILSFGSEPIIPETDDSGCVIVGDFVSESSCPQSQQRERTARHTANHYSSAQNRY